jgi:hypothetical protein
MSMRLVSSGVRAVRIGTENTNDLERETGSQAVLKLIAARSIQTSLVESSEYSMHTPSFGRQGEFRPVGVARTPGLRLCHTSLRAASRQRGVASRSIQSMWWRCRQLRRAFAFRAATRRIQTFWRGYTKQVLFKRYVAARRIQTVWRASAAPPAYQRFVNAWLPNGYQNGLPPRNKFSKCTNGPLLRPAHANAFPRLDHDQSQRNPG